MIRKGLAVAVILLFIGVAFAPSINAKMNNEPIPDLDCEGGLYWDGMDLEPGDVLTGVFTVGNIGEPNSELDWRIMSCPFWGTWTFSPDGMEDLTPEDGWVTVEVELEIAIELNETIGGEIGIQNVDNESDICYIDIQIKKKSSDEDCGCDEDSSEFEWRYPVLCTFLYPLWILSVALLMLFHTKQFVDIMDAIGLALNCFWSRPEY